MYRLDKDSEISLNFIVDAVRDHVMNEGARARKLKDYYEGKQAILRRQYDDPTKPSNKIVNPFANYITDMLVGYFMGNPVSYASIEEDAISELNMIFEYNDEADENSELAKGASIAGKSYELLYIDEDAKIRFASLGAEEVVMVYDDTIEADILYAIRYYPTQDPVKNSRGYKIDVYDKSKISHYKCSEAFDGITSLGETPHPFKLVPLVEYKNNNEDMGDFENVMSLIDAYDRLESDTMNDIEYFCDAYLALVGMEGTEPEDVMSMKENRVMLMPEGSDAKFITKQVDVNYLETQKSRLVEDIHKFSKCPNLNDEKFGGNASGVAMRYKVMGTENLTSIKERKFKKGLQKRIELIFNVLGLYGSAYDFRAIEINFSRNLPSDDAETADLINKLRGLLSDETLISRVSFVDNAQEEMEKRDKEKESQFEMGGFYSDGAEVLGTEDSRTTKEREPDDK